MNNEYTDSMMNIFKAFLIILMVMGASCAEKEPSHIWKPLDVKASAYNSVPEQTDDTPFIGAWGDTLAYRKKSIAVSRDLLSKGLKRNTMVMIEGLPGIYLVKDKMAARWTNKIDIYMGDKIKKAKKWGVKDLSIRYAIAKDSLQFQQQNK